MQESTVPRLSPGTAPDTLIQDGEAPPPLYDGAPAGSTDETRTRYAQECSNKAQQRAIEAEHRAAAAERRIDALLRALDTRGPIDQAKGALMAVFGLAPEAAFEALVWVSQNANIKMCTVAERFLVAMRGIDLGEQAREDVTLLLADLGRPNGQAFN
jgi:hypothetical protein